MPGLVACLLLILLLHPCFVQAQQAPTISAQPTNQAVAVGAGATFSVTAAGRPGSSHDESPRDIECVTSEPCAQVSLTTPLELSKLYNLINWVTPAMFL
jgi:hypothetical protein